MLKYFFEIGCAQQIFDGLKIMEDRKLCDEHMGKYPVISISLKGVDGSTYATARSMLCSIIGNEAMRFQFLFQSERLTDIEKKQYAALVNVNNEGQFVMSDEVLMTSLQMLSKILMKQYGSRAVILIDEYDVPLDKARQAGYYDLMAGLIRNLFHQALKGNDSLYLAVLTGCLRISKESIFTGMNNLQIFSITDVLLDEYFGFTDKEVRELLAYFGLLQYYGVFREWYDGYRFGNTDVYCPWDVINYCRDLRVDQNAQPKTYWLNTSGNSIIRRFLQKAGKTSTRREIEQLIAGETILKEIRQELTYRDLDQTIDNLWSVLFTTGYLTGQGEYSGTQFRLKIPNLEIRQIFTSQIYKWFQETAEKDGERLNAFCEAQKTL